MGTVYFSSPSSLGSPAGEKYTVPITPTAARTVAVPAAAYSTVSVKCGQTFSVSSSWLRIEAACGSISL